MSGGTANRFYPRLLVDDISLSLVSTFAVNTALGPIPIKCQRHRWCFGMRLETFFKRQCYPHH